MAQERKSPIVPIISVVVLAALVAFFAWQFLPREQTTDTPQTTSKPSPAAPAVAEPPIPSFDVVRVTPEGSTVTAGRAQPGATVVILDNGKEIGRVTADSRGEWVFTPDKHLSPGNHELSLRAIGPDNQTVEGGEPVILVVPSQPGGTALAFKRLSKGGSLVLQGPDAAVTDGQLSIEAIDYDEAGQLSANGRGEKSAAIQVYLDDHIIGRAAVGDDGRWRLTPQKQTLAQGDHTLRVDQLRKDGKVSARVEVSFQISDDKDKGSETVTVQPGNSLWRIAQRRYGQGTAYTMIYKANKGQIRDPDLIYPGQVFNMPAQ